MNNKFKNDLTDHLNKLLGLLISLRTVETSPLDSRHWANFHIDSISSLRNDLQDGAFDCEDCAGIGGTYEKEAESLSEAQCCPTCQGRGFSLEKINSTLEALHSEVENKPHSSILKYLEEMKLSPIFKR